MTLSTPNTILWHYSQTLRRCVARVHATEDGTQQRQEIVVCILLAVTLVEAFLNVYFRILVSNEEFTSHCGWLLEDLRRRRSLDHKIEVWPELILRKRLDFSTGAARDFKVLKERRNALMHFTSSHITLDALGDLTFHGLADTSAFDELTAAHAADALEAAEGIICEIWRLRGIPEESLPHMLHQWTGRMAAT